MTQQILIALGGGGGASYSTWNPADKSAGISLSGSDLVATGSSSSHGFVRGTQGHSTGHYYFECVMSVAANECGIGVSNTSLATGSQFGSTSNGWAWYKSGASTYKYSVSLTAFGTAYGTGIVVGVEYNNGDIIFWRDGVSQGTAWTALSGTLYPTYGSMTTAATNVCTLNVGGSAFAYGPPSGASAWG